MFEKTITFAPAYDKRDPDPSKNCGIHGVEVCFVLGGTKGAITLTLFTEWFLPQVQEELKGRSPIGHQPVGADLGYHSRKRVNKYQTRRSQCQHLSAPCYYDGSGLAAEAVRDVLLREGSVGVWAALEERYIAYFHEKE